MRSLFRRLWHDEGGFVVSAELALIATTGVLAGVVGLHAVSGAVNHELNDFSNAIGSLDQSYSYDGYCHPGHSWVAGSAFLDTADDCDCAVIEGRTPRPNFKETAEERANRIKDGGVGDDRGIGHVHGFGGGAGHGHGAGAGHTHGGAGHGGRHGHGAGHGRRGRHHHHHHHHHAGFSHGHADFGPGYGPHYGHGSGRTIILRAENGRNIYVNDDGYYFGRDYYGSSSQFRGGADRPHRVFPKPATTTPNANPKTKGVAPPMPTTIHSKAKESWRKEKLKKEKQKKEKLKRECVKKCKECQACKKRLKKEMKKR